MNSHILIFFYFIPQSTLFVEVLLLTTFRFLHGKLVFVTGRGGAGFHSAGPALTRGRGGYF